MNNFNFIAEVRRKKEEGRRLKSLKKRKFPVDIHPLFYTNDTSGHDIRSYFCNGDLSKSPKIFSLKR
ncbi:MAG: hypothetical protein F6K39_41885 [Okeania sp. SIO3B3]|nr:hypothetical protein [Okeania sp. SIO3B3]